MPAITSANGREGSRTNAKPRMRTQPAAYSSAKISVMSAAPRTRPKARSAHHPGTGTIPRRRAGWRPSSRTATTAAMVEVTTARSANTSAPAEASMPPRGAPAFDSRKTTRTATRTKPAMRHSARGRRSPSFQNGQRSQASASPSFIAAGLLLRDLEVQDEAAEGQLVAVLDRREDAVGQLL